MDQPSNQIMWFKLKIELMSLLITSIVDFSGAFLSCNTEYIVFASQNLNFIQN
jgi:hypothetical protein